MSELNTKNLDQLIKALKKQKLKGRVGILGKTTARDGKLNNATIGAFHEFGTTNLPVRSFLRYPITEKLQKYLQQSGAFSKEAVEDVIKQKSLKPWLQKAVIVAESIVIDAFDTGGFGAWQPSNMKYKSVHMTLVETQQLRDSITSEVKG